MLQSIQEQVDFPDHHVLQIDRLGDFLLGIPHPLGLGKVELFDGRWETGFICEAYSVANAKDINHLGGWRAYLNSKKLQ